MSGGKPGTNPKGGIIGKGGAFGGDGAFAGAGAAFSFLTLEAGFLGMVPWRVVGFVGAPRLGNGCSMGGVLLPRFVGARPARGREKARHGR